LPGIALRVFYDELGHSLWSFIGQFFGFIVPVHCIYWGFGFYIRVFSFFYVIISFYYLFYFLEGDPSGFVKQDLYLHQFSISTKVRYGIGKFYWNHDKKLILFYSVIHSSAKITKGYDQVFLCQGFEKYFTAKRSTESAIGQKSILYNSAACNLVCIMGVGNNHYPVNINTLRNIIKRRGTNGFYHSGGKLTMPAFKRAAPS